MSISTIIDIAVILIILVSAGVSFFRGFVREVLTIIGFIGGGAASYMFAPKLIPVFKGWFGVVEGKKPEKMFDLIPYDIVADICAYAGIFIAVFLVLQLASYFLSASVKAVGLGPVDRALGVVFGIARALLFLGVIYWPFHDLIGDEQKKEVLGKSKTFVYVEGVSNWIQGLVPSHAQKADASNEAIEKVKQLGGAASEKLQEGVKDGIKDSINNNVTNLKEKSGYSDEDRKGLDKLIDTETAPADNPPQPQGQNSNE